MTPPKANLASLALANKPHETTVEWCERRATITDPLVMLATLCENFTYLGYDPYYRGIHEALWPQPKKFAKPPLDLRSRPMNRIVLGVEMKEDRFKLIFKKYCDYLGAYRANAPAAIEDLVSRAKAPAWPFRPKNVRSSRMALGDLLRCFAFLTKSSPLSGGLP